VKSGRLPARLRDGSITPDRYEYFNTALKSMEPAERLKMFLDAVGLKSLELIAEVVHRGTIGGEPIATRNRLATAQWVADFHFSEKAAPESSRVKERTFDDYHRKKQGGFSAQLRETLAGGPPVVDGEVRDEPGRPGGGEGDVPNESGSVREPDGLDARPPLDIEGGEGPDDPVAVSGGSPRGD